MMAKEYIFSYGTLQDPSIQLAVLGRILEEGKPDTLRGHVMKKLQGIHATYNIIVPESGASVDGVVYEVTSEDVVKIDQYEGDAYLRVSVTLKSNLRAWVYRDNPNSKFQQMIVDA